MNFGVSQILEYIEFRALNLYTSMYTSLPQQQESKLRILLCQVNKPGYKTLRQAKKDQDAVQSPYKNDDDPYFEHLAQEFPTGEFENWTRCQQLLPQAEIAYNSIPVSVMSWEAWAQIATNKR
ncbi:hypothetical protein EJ07DRAFT_181110 [Lizonia empirigonia]|nr:hypothetical protein EJ07DRAFT_181110 [Lizonia empirigonia]